MRTCYDGPMSVPESLEKDILARCAELGLDVFEEKEIQYGKQFKCRSSDGDYCIRAFYSKKKGCSLDLSQLSEAQKKIWLGSGLQFTQAVRIAGLDSKKASKEKKDSDIELSYPILASDESGKGDYFGPLVTAAVYVEAGQLKQLEALGVQDSKNLVDEQIRDMAPQLMQILSYQVDVLMPREYNKEYDKLGNLNTLLATRHTRCIQYLYEAHPKVSQILVDQFANPTCIKKELPKNIPSKLLSQTTRAERFLPVAAASILARYHFVIALSELSRSIRSKLPKGCSNHTVNTARRIYKDFGNAILHKVAKTHFSITKQIQDS